MAKKKVYPLQLADEARRAFTLQAEEATRAMSKEIPGLEGAELKV